MEKIMPNRLDRGFYMYQEEFEKSIGGFTLRLVYTGKRIEKL